MVARIEKKTAPAYRAMMGADARRQMMACVIRSKSTLEAIGVELRPEHLEPVERVHAVVYRAVDAYFTEYGVPPDLGVLRAEIEEQAGADLELLNGPEFDQLEEFLAYAFDPETFAPDGPEHPNYVKWAVGKVRQFLKERLAEEVRSAVTLGDGVASDLPGVLVRLTARADAIESLSHIGDDLPFAEGWEEESRLDVTPLGVDFFDEYMDGGTAPGECNVLLGPYNSCKTPVAVMGVVKGGRRAFACTVKPEWDGRRGIAFLFSYEAPKSELRRRTISYAATVHRSTIDTLTTRDALSVAGTLKEYEKGLFPEGTPGERQRVADEEPILNAHVRLVDFTGTDPNNRGAGSGYVSEIARYIASFLRRHPDCYVELVWIDYAGLVVERYINAGHASQDHKRTLLKEMPHHVRNQVAMQFNCPVFLNHQLSADANSRPVTHVMHHTDSGESRGIGENADFVFCIGTKSPDMLVTWNCSKQRRNKMMPPRILRIEGEYNRVVETDGAYVIDTTRREIVPAKDAGHVAAETTEASATTKPVKPAPTKAPRRRDDVSPAALAYGK